MLHIPLHVPANAALLLERDPDQPDVATLVLQLGAASVSIDLDETALAQLGASATECSERMRLARLLALPFAAAP